MHGAIPPVPSSVHGVVLS